MCAHIAGLVTCGSMLKGLTPAKVLPACPPFQPVKAPPLLRPTRD